MQQKITLTLTLPEINQILDALGTLPYAQVYELVAAVQSQAQTQLGVLGSVPEERHG
ncbi:hypothetical protein [Actinomadura flavalba]|uniref:hypothetical protein n=1 Tax=Actinomadura flavalba TaxID=1120938 RepID=UPI00037C63F2|nr:hypothetical protein [Actinomadura flavalba]